jgi:hypothetical protein
VIVLHPYVPGLRPADQAPCWEALSRIRKMSGFSVVDERCEEEHDYAEVLDHHFMEYVGVIIVEHDIAPTPEQAIEMASCPEMFCAMDYAGPSWPSWAAVPYATGIGLAKLSGRLKVGSTRRPFVPRVHWHDVGGALEQVIGRPHVHPGPVVHHHC